MALKKPLVLATNGDLQQIQAGDAIDIVDGGTGATTASGARTNLGVVIGTNVEAWSAELDALAALASAGIIARTGAATFVPRTIVSTAATLAITNGSAEAGNPSLDLAVLANAGGGSFLKLTRDTYGRVSGTTAVTAADITALVNGTYVALAGGTMTGPLTLNADPTSAMHAASKQYVDGVSAGMRIKDAVRAASTANLALSAAQTVDGVALAAGDRVLVKNQTAPAENGIYLVSAGAWTRAPDADTGAELAGGATVWVNQGTTQADNGYTVTTDGAITLGTTAITWTQSSGLGQVTAGNGLTKVGNTLDIGTASTARIVVNADNIDLALLADSAAGTFLKITRDGYGRVSGTTAVTAADVAALLDGDLTALANTATNGLYVRTGTNTSATRAIATTNSARLTVTNGDGTAGNPTLDLATSGIAAGTYAGITFDAYGRATAATTSNAAVISIGLTNGEAAAIAIGQAVYVSGAGAVKKALANAVATKDVLGLVLDTTIASAGVGNIAVEGIVTATTAQWDAVTGQTGGLTAGAAYFLDNVTTGKITTVAPTSGFLARVGLAISTTQFKIGVAPPVQF